MHPKSLTPLLALLASLPAAATDRTWDGGDATANMAAALNWNGNTAINPAVDRLFFPTGLAAADRIVNNNYAANTRFHHFQFQDAYTLNGTIMELDEALLCFHDAGATVTVNAGLSLQGVVSLNTSNGNLVFGAGSQIYTNGNTVGFRPVFSSSSITVSGLLSGNGQLNVTGAGEARFTGAKSFTAMLGIGQGGTLTIDNNSGLGTGAGTTSISNGTLVLDSVAALTVPESILMSNADPDSSRIVSKGGAHTLSGPITFSGDWFKRFEVQGTGLTLSGVISGPETFGSMRKTGTGRLTLSGAASNTFGIQIFSAYEGETFLNKSGGATAISSPFILIGNNAAPADSAIVRLGASHQIADATSVDISSDGWFDLNGQQETIDYLDFNGKGRLTTGAGALRVEGMVRALSAAQDGGEAIITGPVTLGAAESVWEVYGGASGILLTANGPLSQAMPGTVLRKINAGHLRLNGNHTVSTIRCEDGSLTLSGNSPATQVEFTAGNVYGSGAVALITGTGGTLHVGAVSTIATLNCQGLSFVAPAGVLWTFTGAQPGGHDQINVTGTVNVTGADWGFQHVGPHTTVPGDEVVLIANDGADAIVGEFSNLPEGTVFQSYLVSYHGGDGNDFTLTKIIPPTGTTRLWDGGGADDNWMTANNWNPNGQPQPGDALVFPTAANRKSNVNNFPAGTTFQSITVHGDGYQLNGSQIVLNESVAFTSLTAMSNMFGIPLKLALPASVSVAGQAFVQHTGAVNTNGKLLTLTNSGPGGSGGLSISGVISGTGGVMKTGPGAVIFYETVNTYTGVTTVAAGTLALKADGTLGSPAPASGTTVSAGATLELRSNEGSVLCYEPITLHGTIADNGGTFAANLYGKLTVPVSGTLTASGDHLGFGALIEGAGVLHKNGAGRLIIEDGLETINTLSGGFFADAGTVLLRKYFAGSTLFTCPVIIGNAGLPAVVELDSAHVLGDNVNVQIVHPSGVFDTKSYAETIGAIVMNGGTVQGTGRLTLSSGQVNVQTNAATAVISAPLGTNFPATGHFIVNDGASATDLRVAGSVFGTTWDKTGAGRVDFTASMPVAAFDTLDIIAGSALFFSNCQFTAVTLSGGLLGGQGTVGNITTLTSGTVSPGSSPGAFGGSIAAWDKSTTLRMELNGTDPGSGYDQYFANGTTDLNNAALALTAGYDPAPGTTFMIIRNVSGSPITGIFSGIPQNGYVSAPGAKIFQINYTGGDGDDVVLTRVQKDAPEIVQFQYTPGPGVTDDGSTHLVFKGVPGLTYLLEQSTDLLAWSNAGSLAATIPDGLLNFDLIEPAGTPRKFYRLSLP